MDSVQDLKEVSIHQAIADLEEVSWKLNSKVFGEGVKPSEDTRPPSKEDRVAEARTRIVEVNRRLEEVLHGLRNL